MIGFKEPSQEPKNRVDSKQTIVRNNAAGSGDAEVFGVDNLQQGSNAEQTDTNSVSDLTQETTSTKPQMGNNNKIIAIVVLVFVITIIAIVVLSNSSKKKDNTNNSSNASNTNTSQEQLYPDVSESSNFQASTEENPNAVYDEYGNLISNNGVYDEDGNVIDKDAIQAGLPNFSDSEQGETTAKVFGSNDFIKDLNGIDIPAVYNVKSRDYINDFVNYEAKRAIMSDGMELYWLEVTYHDKPYRVQVPFYVFKDLDDKGICVVNMEVLTLDGGEKVISYMQVVYDYQNLINDNK